MRVMYIMLNNRFTETPSRRLCWATKILVTPTEIPEALQNQQCLLFSFLAAVAEVDSRGFRENENALALMGTLFDNRRFGSN
jgi:hypothetical protein